MKSPFKSEQIETDCISMPDKKLRMFNLYCLIEEKLYFKEEL